MAWLPSRRVVRSAIGIALAAALALVLASCGARSAGDPVVNGNGQNFVAGDGTATFIAPSQRQASPNISGKTLDDASLSLASLRGHVVVLNVWGSFCGPCRSEAPTLRAAYHNTKAHGVRFVGIDTRDQVAAARAFVDAFHVPYPSLVDQSGSMLLAFRNTLPPSAIPSTLVLDRNGDVAARVVGPVTYTQLMQLINKVVAEKA